MIDNDILSSFTFEGKVSCFTTFFINKPLLFNCSSFSYIKDVAVIIKSSNIIYVYEIPINEKKEKTLKIHSCYNVFLNPNGRTFYINNSYIFVLNSGVTKQIYK